MKYMNLKKRYKLLDLQIFAEGEDDGEDSGDEGDDQDDDDSDEDGDDEEEERKFSQKDVDNAVSKRLAREKRKWEREHRKSRKKKDDGEQEDTEGSKAVKAAEERASKAEVKVACYEAGVAKDAVDDVVALARSYMAADEELDLEEAIEKVVKKYPQFKSAADSDDEEEDSRGKSWGKRQKSSLKKMSGVEKKFYEMNPDLKPKM